MRLKNVILLFGIILLSAGPVFGDSESDARAIAEQTITEERMALAIALWEPTIVSGLTKMLDERHLVVDDLDALLEMFLDEFRAEVVHLMREGIFTVYLDIFSPAELDGIATFYTSAAGQALLRKSPELEKAGVEVSESISNKAAKRTGPRFAARMEKEGVRVTSDATLLDWLIDFFSR